MTILEAKRTTLADYEVIAEAYRLKGLDDRFLASFTAFQNAKAQSSDKNGRPIYNTFKKLFDYEKELELLKNPNVTKKTKKEDIDIFKRLEKLNEEVE